MTRAAAITAEMGAAQLEQLRARLEVDGDDFLLWLHLKQWTWQQLERGEYGLTLEEAQLLYVMEDPVLWCRAFLTDPDTGKPYEFFDYQVPSVRAWHQDVIHQDGAEVGKTREIVALLLWGSITGLGGSVRNPWFLVGAPQQTHLDEIIMALEEHCGVEEDRPSSGNTLRHFWRRPKRTPHTMHRLWGAMGPSRIYYRPGGHDGEAFRGVHVNAMAFYDEMAKSKGKKVLSEFMRAMKPGCRFRGYSVPDGDNETEYYRMTTQAIPGLKSGAPGIRLFHWSKLLMPPPFWSPERKARLAQFYGGEDTPGYQRNVLGLHGQQENPVWSWELLLRNVFDVPEWRMLELNCNDQSDELHRIVKRVELKLAEGRKSGEEHVLVDEYQALHPYRVKNREALREEVRKLVREAFAPWGPGMYWWGADLGFSKDPTEILMSREIGGDLRDLLRVKATGVSYDLQCELIYCLDELNDFQGDWGVDFGAAGTAVVQMLQNLPEYADGHYEERMTGFNFAAALDAVDEQGEAVTEEKDGEQKAVRLPAKELATNLITGRLQRGGHAMPYDAEALGHMSNHTAREGARWRIFSKQNDHTIDARRVQMLRKAFSQSYGGVDVFASGVQVRNAA